MATLKRAGGRENVRALEKASLALDRLAGKWWFYAFLFFLGFGLLPPYASRGYSWEEMGDVVSEGLSHAVVYRLVDLVWPSVLLHVLALAVIAAVALWGEKASRAFDIWAFATYLAIAVGQGTGISDRYGLVILTGNVALGFLVAFSWGLECLEGRNKFGKEYLRPRRLWLAPLAAWAYWSPVEPFRLDPCYLIVGYFGVAYCLTTPVVLALMALYYPGVNKTAMRLTAFLGLIFGVLNVSRPLMAGPTPTAIWEGTILHLPLLITSAYALGITIGASRKRG